MTLQLHTAGSLPHWIIKDSPKVSALPSTMKSATEFRMNTSSWRKGDIINVDVSTILDGYFSDASRMFMIGEVSERAKRLVRVTEECVELGLAAAKPWGHLGDIADAINTHAQANGYSVVEEIGGHGIGLEFHEDPFVSYVTPKGKRDAARTGHDVYHRADD